MNPFPRKPLDQETAVRLARMGLICPVTASHGRLSADELDNDPILLCRDCGWYTKTVPA